MEVDPLQLALHHLRPVVDDEEEVHGGGTADDGELLLHDGHLQDDLKGNLRGGGHRSVDQLFLDLGGGGMEIRND